MATDRGVEQIVNITGTSPRELVRAVVKSSGLRVRLGEITFQSARHYFAFNKTGDFEVIVKSENCNSRPYPDGADIWHSIPRGDRYYLWTSDDIQPPQEKQLQECIKKMHESPLMERIKGWMTDVRWVIVGRSPKGRINFQ